MRIPLYPDDLIRNRGFKSMAKKLRKLLHGPSRIPLSFAEDILAKGFGYRSYYDLEQTAKTCQPAELTVTQSEANRAIFSGINAALQTEEATANEQELRRLVCSFALESLVAFKRRQDTVAPCDLMSWKQLNGQRPEVTEDQLQAIERVVKLSGHRIEQALFACMTTGLRPHEYLTATHQIPTAVYRVDKLRFGFGSTLLPMPEGCRASIAKYAKASKLSAGDYLFPSSRDPKRPMSRAELDLLLASWTRKANIQSGLITPLGIRKSAVISRLKSIFRSS